MSISCSDFLFKYQIDTYINMSMIFLLPDVVVSHSIHLKPYIWVNCHFLLPYSYLHLIVGMVDRASRAECLVHDITVMISCPASACIGSLSITRQHEFKCMQNKCMHDMIQIKH